MNKRGKPMPNCHENVFKKRIQGNVVKKLKIKILIKQLDIYLIKKNLKKP